MFDLTPVPVVSVGSAPSHLPRSLASNARSAGVRAYPAVASIDTASSLPYKPVAGAYSADTHAHRSVLIPRSHDRHSYNPAPRSRSRVNNFRTSIRNSDRRASAIETASENGNARDEFRVLLRVNCRRLHRATEREPAKRRRGTSGYIQSLATRATRSVRTSASEPLVRSRHR